MGVFRLEGLNVRVHGGNMYGTLCQFVETQYEKLYACDSDMILLSIICNQVMKSFIDNG